MDDSCLSIRFLKLLLTANKDDVEREILQIEQAHEELKEIKKENSKLLHQNEELKNTIKKHSHEDNGIQRFTEKQLKKTEDQLAKAKQERDEAKSRLSQLMGQRLTDNNSAIADLSDVNRPQNIGHRYSELYDNQWTDAFDNLQLHFKDERKTVDMLVKILMNALAFCEVQMYQLKIKIAKTCLMTEDERRHLNPTQNKLAKDLLKATAVESSQRIYKLYESKLIRHDNDTSFCALKILPFLKECCDICWLMCAQDPPVVFGTLPKEGDTYDNNVYKEYTKRGRTVDFAVWPAMLLHQDGNVLCRGIVQCIPSQESKRPSSAPASRSEDLLDAHFYSQKHETTMRRRDTKSATMRYKALDYGPDMSSGRDYYASSGRGYDTSRGRSYDASSGLGYHASSGRAYGASSGRSFKDGVY